MQVVQLVDCLDGRGGVVDAGGEGALGDVDELAEAEGGVLLEGPLRADADRAQQGLHGQLRGLAPDLEERAAMGDEVAHHGHQREGDARLAGTREEVLLVHGDEHAGGAGVGDAERGEARGPLGGSVLRVLANALRVHALQAVARLVADAGEDDHGADGLGDVVDVEDEGAHAEHGEHDREPDGQRGHVELDALRRAPHGAQRQQGVDERAHEDAQGELALPVPEEGAQDAGGELVAGLLEHEDGDGEDEAGERHHRGGHRGEHRARAFGTAAEEIPGVRVL
jgi:hypothetical protein